MVDYTRGEHDGSPLHREDHRFGIGGRSSSGGRGVVLGLEDKGYSAQWYDPRAGDVCVGQVTARDGEITVEAPEVGDDPDRPQDWVLTFVAPAI